MDLRGGCGSRIVKSVDTPSGIRVIRLTLARGRHPLHGHELATLTLVLSGEMADTADERRNLRGGDMLYVAGGEEHRNVVFTETVQAIHVSFPQPVAVQLCRAYGYSPRVVVRNSGELGGLPMQLAVEVARGDAAAPLAVEGLILQLVAEAARLRQERAAGSPQWLFAAVDYVRGTTDHAVTSREVAGVVGTTERQVRDGFRMFIGKTVSQVSGDARVRRAVELLATDTPLVEVAARLGYYDQSHFTRAFRRVTTQTPRQVRVRRRGVVPTASR